MLQSSRSEVTRTRERTFSKYSLQVVHTLNYFTNSNFTFQGALGRSELIYNLGLFPYLELNDTAAAPTGLSTGDIFYKFNKNNSQKLIKIICFQFKGWNHLQHQPVLKFPKLPTDQQEKSAGISKWSMIRLVPFFKLKTKHLYFTCLNVDNSYLLSRFGTR